MQKEEKETQKVSGRPIRFRAWIINSPDKELYEDETMCGYDVVIDDLNWFLKCNDLQKDSFILMQFTGLLDKNGKEIYEGDIVEFDCVNEKNEERTERCTIIWAKYDYQLIDKNHRNSPIYAIGEDVVEIIGNIYQHPELIEKEI